MVAAFDSKRPWLIPGAVNAWPQPGMWEVTAWLRGGGEYSARGMLAGGRADVCRTGLVRAGLPVSVVLGEGVGMAAGAPAAPASLCRPWCCWGWGLTACCVGGRRKGRVRPLKRGEVALAPTASWGSYAFLGLCLAFPGRVCDCWTPCGLIPASSCLPIPQLRSGGWQQQRD